VGGNVRIVGWDLDEKALGHIREAEKLFRSGDLEKAEVEYKACLALQPRYGTGWLCLGDVPFGRKDYASALEDYRKAIEIDPSLAQAHRFAADALAHLGKYLEAEEEYINAVAWDPGYSEAWQALKDLGKSVGFTVEEHPFRPPAGLLGSGNDGSVQIGIPKDQGGKDSDATRWLAYATCKAVWRFEPGFREKHGAKAGSKYELSSAEEQSCLATYIEGALNNEKAERSRRKQTELEIDALAASAPGDVGFLFTVLKSGMLYEYVLFEDIGRFCPSAVSLYPSSAIDRVKAYLQRFVVIHPGPAARGAVG
jgi:tetratricopeptide (TPR) repeat protein